jgi:hypothetical protein
LNLEATEKNKTMQTLTKNYQELKVRADENDKWMHERKNEIEKKDKIISILRNEKETLEKNSQAQEVKYKKDIEQLKKKI